jgi:hypothetical protein
MFHMMSTTSDQIRPWGFDRPEHDPAPLPEAVLVRRAAASDDAQIRALAQLDNRRLPSGPFLVAELNGKVVAAVSLSTGTAVADPFRATGDAVAMLRLRALQVGGATSEIAVRRSRRSRGQAFTAAAA